jgi:hypothetical protein
LSPVKKFPGRDSLLAVVVTKPFTPSPISVISFLEKKIAIFIYKAEKNS